MYQSLWTVFRLKVCIFITTSVPYYLTTLTVHPVLNKALEMLIRSFVRNRIVMAIWPVKVTKEQNQLLLFQQL